MEEWDQKFLLGLGILFGWCFVICCCASPQLFRELIDKFLCCNRGKKKREQLEKIKAAQERVRSASKSFLATSGMIQPNQIVLHQAMAPLWPEPILEEESRAGSVLPDCIRIESPSISSLDDHHGY
uniref:Uncharacterized protein n=1 Tax=Panagrolaimus sp. JU765 TaxID=591449 RepID=A0AC34PZT7_9BILA